MFIKVSEIKEIHSAKIYKFLKHDLEIWHVYNRMFGRSRNNDYHSRNRKVLIN